MLGKPIRLVKKKTDHEFKEKVADVLKEVLPGMLEEHDKLVRKKITADRESDLEDMKADVLQSISSQLAQVGTLTDQYKSLVISAKDVLREKIVAIYENNKDKRKLRHFERHALEQYYKDYKAMKGNTYIETLYNRMQTWETEPDDYE